MTTAAPHTRTTAVAPGVRGAAALALVAGSVCILLAALTADGAAVLGATIGTALVLATFAFGALTVNAVAARLPAASLLVAMLTYTLQVLLLALVFVALTRSGATDGEVNAQWLGVTAIVVTLAWVTGQTVGAVRTRQPLYELGDSRGAGTQQDRGGEPRP